MQRSDLFSLANGQSASAIGFGCASLGSRVDAKTGLAALSRAFDAGINWFDAAPSYGDAEAETILGRFLVGKRDQSFLCTKVGISPARRTSSTHLIKPLARGLVRLFPGIRKSVSRARPRAIKQPLSASAIYSSLSASLARLGTDYVDVLALHGAAPEEVLQDDILGVLDKITRNGMARAISIASNVETGVMGCNGSRTYRVLQVANNPFQPELGYAREHLQRGADVVFVSHSAFGSAGAFGQLHSQLSSRSEARAALAHEGYVGSIGAISAAFLVDFALSANAKGITLFSMFTVEHLEFNIARLTEMKPRAKMEELAQRLGLGARE
jgi:aryl-alcohol dehydrogenase-like predicted oxidoreductase